MGLNGERVQSALKKRSVEETSMEYYRFNNLDDHDLKLILKAFEIDIPTKLFKKGELKSMKSQIKITK